MVDELNAFVGDYPNNARIIEIVNRALLWVINPHRQYIFFWSTKSSGSDSLVRLLMPEFFPDGNNVTITQLTRNELDDNDSEWTWWQWLGMNLMTMTIWIIMITHNCCVIVIYLLFELIIINNYSYSSLSLWVTCANLLKIYTMSKQVTTIIVHAVITITTLNFEFTIAQN